MDWGHLSLAPSSFLLLLAAISLGAGILGSVLGLGGGLIVIPALTLLFGVDIRYAIGASLVAVIATSSGSAAIYLRDRVAHLRLSVLLEVATVSGALVGVLLAPYVSVRALYFLFAAVMVYSALVMFRNRRRDRAVSTPAGGAAGVGVTRADASGALDGAVAGNLQPPMGRLEAWLKLDSVYPDAFLKRDVPYQVHRFPLGFALMWVAGVISALLGIGSGALKVPAMDGVMRLPIKVSTATSNFMMGVTAAASAGAYFMRGYIVPEIAAPVALGVFGGAWLGSRLMLRLPGRTIRVAFIVVLVILALQMVMKGVRS